GGAVRAGRPRPRHPGAPRPVPSRAAGGGQPADLAVRPLGGRPAQHVAAGRGGDELAGPRAAPAGSHPGPRLLPGAGPGPRLHVPARGRQSAGGCAADGGGSTHPGRGEMRLALAVLAAVHLAALGAGFLAPYPPTEQNRMLPYAPPTRLHFVDTAGRLPLPPFVYGDDETQT